MHGKITASRPKAAFFAPCGRSRCAATSVIRLPAFWAIKITAAPFLYDLLYSLRFIHKCGWLRLLLFRPNLYGSLYLSNFIRSVGLLAGLRVFIFASLPGKPNPKNSP